MKRIFTSAIAIAALAFAAATPARATTFPSLTTIYVAPGAMDNTPVSNSGIATLINCSNMSGQTASVRYQFRADDGTPLAGGTLLLASLASHIIATSGDVQFLGANAVIPTGSFGGGTIQILSTQSAIFCGAMLVHAGGLIEQPQGVALHMVRFNPHPGTVE